MVREIFLYLRKYFIRLHPIWVSRDNVEIKLAYLGSPEIRSDDYSFAQVCLAKLLVNFPPVTIDAMASSSNTICSKFFSKYQSLNSLGVDFFSQSLDKNEFYFIFPPVSMAVSTLSFLESQKVEGILIIPIIWPTSS